jgi:hypothetical protein
MQPMLTHQLKQLHPTHAAAGGQPNPQWIAWLMGFPVAWLSSALSAMPSSRNASSRSTNASPTLSASE